MRPLRVFLLALIFSCAGPASAQEWTPLTPANVMDIVVGAGPSPVLLAVQFVPDKAARSTDGGHTWVPIDVAGQRPARFLAAPSDGNVFYALVGDTGLAVVPPPRALYRSNDAGKTWQLASSRIATPAGDVIDNLAVGATPDLIYGSRMAASICFTGSCTFEGVEGWVSTDGGRTWKRSDPAPGSGGHTAWPSASDPQVAYATTRSGLYRTQDQGASWQLLMQAGLLSFVWEKQVLVDAVDASTLYGRLGSGPELWVSEDGGRNWRTALVPGSWARLMADPLVAGRVYAVGVFGEIFETRDRARTWQRVANTSARQVTNVNHTDPAVAVEGGRRVVYALGQRAVLFDVAAILGTALWWNPLQSGWGLSLTHHANGQLFGAWFRYDAQGDPTWLVMPGGAWVDARTFRATIDEMHGPPYFSGRFDSSRVTATPVGEATLVFDDNSNALFSYRLNDGTAGETRITRQLFGPPASVGLLDYADLWWNPAESGWGVAVAQQYANAFAVWFVYDAAGRPTWFVIPDAVYGAQVVGNEVVFGFHGGLFSTKGPPSTQPFDPARVVVTPVGRASLAFDNISRDTGSLIYSFTNGTAGTRAIARQPF